MSPQIVTGAETGWTFDSSRRRSFNFSQHAWSTHSL